MSNVISYLNTKDGSQSLFYAAKYSVLWGSRAVSAQSSRVVQDLIKGFGLTGDSLFIVDFFSNLKQFGESISDFKNRKVSQLKNVGYTILGVFSSGVDSLRFLGDILGKTLAGRFTLIGSGSGVLRSAIDIKNDLAKFCEKGSTMVEPVKLTLLKVARTTSFLAADALAVLGVLFASWNVGTMIMAALTSGLIFNVTTHFYGKSLESKFV